MNVPLQSFRWNRPIPCRYSPPAGELYQEESARIAERRPGLAARDVASGVHRLIREVGIRNCAPPHRRRRPGTLRVEPLVEPDAAPVGPALDVPSCSARPAGTHCGGVLDQRTGQGWGLMNANWAGAPLRVLRPRRNCCQQSGGRCAAQSVRCYRERELLNYGHRTGWPGGR